MRSGCPSGPDWRRALLSVLLLASSIVGAPAFAAAPEPDQQDQTEARAAYESGETAYRLGRFDEAAREFERAYELSGLPAFLYNIGLAHLRWYDIDPDIAHLRKAKVVFENYQIELQKDPELGDPEEAKILLAEIEQKMATHASEPEPESEPVREGPDPGKPLRLAGAVTMGVGGVLVIGGVVAGVVMALRSREFSEELDKTYAVQAEADCSNPAFEALCQQIDDRIGAASRNGRKANLLAVGLGVGLAGAGLIAVISGAVVFARGTKLTRAAAARPGLTGVAPVWTPSSGGVAIQGRF